MFSRKLITVLRQSMSYSTTWHEIKIPVPWGHVAGKWWGPQNKRPILATHGWQDNSGTFDTLIPLLPQTSSFLAIDFPGCGYSSKLPPGKYCHLMDLVILIRRIVKYFDWDRVSFMGHSMGAGLNYAYAMLYPNEVEFLVCLDFLKPSVEDKSMDNISTYIDHFLKSDRNLIADKKPPSYTLQEMEQKLHKSYESIALDKCGYILQRNVERSRDDPDKFHFTVDPRLKTYNLIDFSQEALVKNAHRLTCPIFYSKSTRGIHFEKKEYVVELLEALRKHNKNVEVHDVDGTHHGHLNNPNCLEGALNDFLKKYDVGDRSKSGIKQENLS